MNLSRARAAPPRPMSQQNIPETLKRARFEVSDWLETFDNRALEFFNGMINVIQACMVLTIVDGKSVAPFLEGAIFRLDSEARAPVWVSLLLIVGFLQLAALAVDTKRHTFSLRLVASIAAAFMSLAVVLALGSSAQPAIMAIRYVVPVFSMTFAAGCLFARRDAALAEKEMHNATTRS